MQMNRKTQDESSPWYRCIPLPTAQHRPLSPFHHSPYPLNIFLEVSRRQAWPCVCLVESSYCIIWSFGICSLVISHPHSTPSLPKRRKSILPSPPDFPFQQRWKRKPLLPLALQNFFSHGSVVCVALLKITELPARRGQENRRQGRNAYRGSRRHRKKPSSNTTPGPSPTTQSLSEKRRN